MKWLTLGLMALSKLPVERLLVRRPDPIKSIEKLEELLTQGNPPLSSPTAEAGTKRALGGSATAGMVKKEDMTKVTTEETVAYQKREMGKELLLLEKHLQQKCKIAGKACDCCLPAGTKIYTNPAIAVIEKPGDKVITHTGQAREVTKVFKREYKGPLNKLSIGYTNIPLLLTPEHQLLVAPGVRKRQRDLWRKSGISEESLKWVPAVDLCDRDFIAFPRLKMTKDRSDIDAIFAELLGWYLAEGSCSGNRITFSLGKDETQNISRVKTLIRDKFKAEPKFYLKPTGVHICYTNKRDVSIFREFGIGARKKVLPQWFLSLPHDKQSSFLKGALKGDGHLGKYSIVYTTTSEILAYQLRLLLFRLGFLHSMDTREIGRSLINGREIIPRGPRYDLIVAGDAARAMESSFNGGSRTSGNHGWISENFAFLPIRSNRQVSFSGMLYNIAVEEDESYLTIHGAVHNCEKHPLAIEALAQETLGITGDGIYHEVATWARNIMPVTTEAASRSGSYDEEYPALAVTARDMRKRIVGSEDVKALLSPDLNEKVYADVQAILDKAFRKEGGNDERATEEAV